MFSRISLLFEVEGGEGGAETKEDPDEDVLAQEAADCRPEDDAVCDDQKFPGENAKKDQLEVGIRI